MRLYGEDHVGLLTGDNVINGDAPVVVMTTEVLRNMIYARSPALDRLRYAVLDEVHYLQDPARGQGQVHGELSDHRLAGAGGRRYQHPVAPAQSLTRPELVVVEGEVVQGLELGQGRPVLRPPPPGLGITLGRAGGHALQPRRRLRAARCDTAQVR